VAATTNPYKIVLPWLSMQLGKLGLGETGFFEGTRRANRAHSAKIFPHQGGRKEEWSLSCVFCFLDAKPNPNCLGSFFSSLARCCF
jgi:hypothetical protein